MHCFNIGYQEKSLSGLCKILSENAVEILIDVRERAWSQRPEFRKERLQISLASYGIEYYHCKIAGNPFRPRDGKSLNFKDCAEKYGKHLKQAPEVIDVLEKVIKNKRTALFCYEKERSFCHRDILLTAILKRIPKIEVVDL